MSFPGRNECPGIHCSLIVKEEREAQLLPESLRYKAGQRRQSESQRGVVEKRNGRLVSAAEATNELEEERRLQQKNLNTLDLPNKKGLPKYHKTSSWQGRQSHLCQKKKEQSRLSRPPDREVEKSKGE